jgi:RNase H-fold protein (predicted Holliday junction resolvase)
MVIGMHDERFSTAIADDRLRAAKSKRKKSDDAAAAVFLQAYLDGAS